MTSNANQQVLNNQKAAVESSLNVARIMFDASERLVVLNVNTARTALEDVAANVHTLFAAKKPEELFAQYNQMLQPAAEKLVAYYRNAYEIFAQAAEEIAKPIEAHMAETGKMIAAEMEKAAKKSPIGADAAVAAVKQTLAAANNTYDQMSKAGRQVAEIAEANIAAAGEAVVKASTSTTPSRTSRRSA